MDVFVRDPFTMIAAPVQRDVDGVPKRSHLRLVHRVAQMCNADASDHRRVAKDGWRAGEVIKESKPSSDIDMIATIFDILTFLCIECPFRCSLRATSGVR
jgi:hypothetical protein